MNSNKKEIFKCCLKILSPVHLGCDEVYEPMGFRVDEQNSRLVVFDPITFISGLPDSEKKRFSDICKKGSIGSILEIYKFMKGRMVDGKSVEVCGGFLDHYRDTLKMNTTKSSKIQKVLNKFTIDRTAFQMVDQRPYVPGSAVKGALRTAYLNALQKIKKAPPQKGNGANKDLEKMLLDDGSFDTDPFRMVKVSDFRPVGEASTKVIYAVNRKKKDSKFEPMGPYQILEVIQPGMLFSGEITVDQPEKNGGIKNPVQMVSLLKTSDWFYQKEKKREDRELENIGTPVIPFSGKNEKLIRIGRHSGAECLTIEGHRQIKIIKKNEKPEVKDHSTTLWLAAPSSKNGNNRSLAPFGWAALYERTPEMEPGLEEREKTWLADEEKRKKEAAARSRISGNDQIPEKKTKVKREELSPLEKMLKRLDLMKSTEMGKIGTIIQEIDTLESDADKGTVALAIKKKVNPKTYKKNKHRDYLNGLIRKAGLE